MGVFLWGSVLKWVSSWKGRRESVWHLKAFSFSCPLWKKLETTDSEICYVKSSCFELMTLIHRIINISSVWQMFLVVAFYSAWYLGSAWFSNPPSPNVVGFFSFILIPYCVFDRWILPSLMGKPYVSSNNEWPVIHRCIFVLQTKIYTNGATQCQWSTVRRSRLRQIKAGTYIMLCIENRCQVWAPMVTSLAVKGHPTILPFV